MVFTSPPTWPAAHAGWMLPAGWQPDPAWPPAPQAWDFYRPHPADVLAAQLRRQAQHHMVIGAVIVTVGVVVTLITYALTPPGGHDAVLWGAVIFGALRVVRGAVRYGRAAITAEVAAQVGAAYAPFTGPSTPGAWVGR